MDTRRDELTAGEGVEVATLSGGCFWCLEAVFEQVRGVSAVVSGYSGGETPHPTYEQVCTGRTGHAEAVQVTFDPQAISYRDLLLVFFAIHDPTTLNSQGPDVGTQYRSAVFYHSAEQRETAQAVIQELSAQGLWARPVVTEVTPFTAFYEAEEYHKEYYRRNPDSLYCQAIITPKLAKFRKEYVEKLRTEGPSRI
jgi:peptide-methionine (S)-S-oxide reductase